VFVDNAHIDPYRGVPPDDLAVGDDEGGLAIEVLSCELAVRQGGTEAELFIDHFDDGPHDAVVRVCGLRTDGNAVQSVEEVILRGPNGAAGQVDWIAEATQDVLIGVRGVQAEPDIMGKSTIIQSVFCVGHIFRIVPLSALVRDWNLDSP
jgi:hypothetical protein